MNPPRLLSGAWCVVKKSFFVSCGVRFWRVVFLYGNASFLGADDSLAVRFSFRTVFIPTFPTFQATVDIFGVFVK